jgi:hypothetical protein
MTRRSLRRRRVMRLVTRLALAARPADLHLHLHLHPGHGTRYRPVVGDSGRLGQLAPSIAFNTDKSNETISNIGSNLGYGDGVSTYVPPGWPSEVHPPGSERFEDTAMAWLLELVPPEYRRYGVLRRYPPALARMACHHLNADVEAARQGFRTARTELAGLVPPHGIEAVLDTYRREGTRLAALAKAAELVEIALRGPSAPGDPDYQRRFTPKL